MNTIRILKFVEKFRQLFTNKYFIENEDDSEYIIPVKKIVVRKQRTITEALEYILQKYDILTKDELDDWCGTEGRKKLYNAVKRLAHEHWERISKPEAYVRSHYEKLLEGYLKHDLRK